MHATTHTADHRLLPAVVIIGNDAVLAAVPATPVQLAHACLQRGFTIAVPASWGDELIASESVRRLAARAKGPAVMCVCPFVRSRLLAPGPDLAPFLVALVSPPVATARYVRTLYGERDVHITYVGACPSTDDSAIDERLTPDAFLADLAEHGIALSEQPLVFESTVPPDRRRWYSLPGGVPSTDALGNDTDTRTLVEIDRDDVSTDLAQHIIAHEHVLIDLAPSLGCVCSGATSSVAPRSARAAIMALEPPRALGAVVDPAAIVSLEVFAPEPPSLDPEPAVAATIDVVAADAVAATDDVQAPVESVMAPDAPSDDRDSYLDALLGTSVESITEPTEGELSSDDFVDIELEADTATGDEPLASDPATIAVIVEDEAADEDVPEPSVEIVEEITVVAHGDMLVVIASDAIETVVMTQEIQPAELEAIVTEAASPPVRRRTPPSMPVRHSTSSIPKTVAGGGRPLPRAYVAKRRTPPAGSASISSHPITKSSAPPVISEIDEPIHASPIESSKPIEVVVDSLATDAAADHAVDHRSEVSVAVDVAPDTSIEPEIEIEPEIVLPGPIASSAPAEATRSPQMPPRSGFSSSVMSRPGPINFPLVIPRTSEGDGGSGSVAAPAANRGALMMLLVAALLALGISALFLLRG